MNLTYDLSLWECLGALDTTGRQAGRQACFSGQSYRTDLTFVSLRIPGLSFMFCCNFMFAGPDFSHLYRHGFCFKFHDVLTINRIRGMHLWWALDPMGVLKGSSLTSQLFLKIPRQLTWHSTKESAPKSTL